jgi:effector-binding domain-containing protein
MMQHDVRLEMLSASQALAVVRRRAAIRQLSKVIPEACGIVWNTLKAHHVTGAGRHVAVYLDTQLELLNLEVGVELSSPLIAPADEVVPSTLPTGRVATATHFGPYAGLAKTHQAVRDWCAENGHALAGANWELYGHWADEWNQDPSKIRTDVSYLLK